MLFDFRYLGDSRWRVSVLCFAGRLARAEGDIVRMARLVVRAEQLFEIWARPKATASTIPAGRTSQRSTRPASPSGARAVMTRSLVRAKNRAPKHKASGD